MQISARQPCSRTTDPEGSEPERRLTGENCRVLAGGSPAARPCYGRSLTQCVKHSRRPNGGALNFISKRTNLSPVAPRTQRLDRGRSVNGAGKSPAGGVRVTGDGSTLRPRLKGRMSANAVPPTAFPDSARKTLRPDGIKTPYNRFGTTFRKSQSGRGPLFGNRQVAGISRIQIISDGINEKNPYLSTLRFSQCGGKQVVLADFVWETPKNPRIYPHFGYPHVENRYHSNN